MTKTEDPGMSQRYSDACDAVSDAIADWLETHPGAEPRYRFPPPRVVVSGDLPNGLAYWQPNDDGRALVEYVERVTGERYGASMLQFQVCFQQHQQHGRRRRSKGIA